MKIQSEKQLITGTPWKVILSFTLPVFLGTLFQQLYNVVDAAIVGRYVGVSALGAVGSMGSLVFLINGFVLGMSVVFTVLLAQRYGAQDFRGLREAFGSAIVLSFAGSLLLTVLFLLVLPSVLLWMHTPEDLYALAKTYICIYAAGFGLQVMYNLLSCALRSLGDSKRPLYFLVFSSALNIALDLLFILGFHMGTGGAAFATILSQGVSGLCCIVYIARFVPILHLKKEDFRLKKENVKQQLSVGFPMALQYSITSIGGTMMQSSVNLLGSNMVASFTAAHKIDHLASQAFVALGTTSSTFSAQNYGAGNIKRVREGFFWCSMIGFVYSILAGGALILWGKYLTAFFVKEGAEMLMEEVATYLLCVCSFYIPLTIVNVFRNGLQGLGFGFLPMLAGIAEFFGRALMAFLSAQKNSYLLVCFCGPAAWVLAGGLLLVMYMICLKKCEKETSCIS